VATEQDKIFMQRCLELAKLAKGNTSPNPMVGSVIVHKGKIIGEGYHKKCGEAHAEVQAVNSVKDKTLLKSSTIYVNLEPCAHIGRTPSCANMIIENKIPRVVIGCLDSFEKVDGKGMQMLRNAGCEIEINVLHSECRELNRRFFTFHEKKRPYVILKWAQTIDGLIDLIRPPLSPIQSNWISDEHSRTWVHKLRAEEDSIMIGTNTVEKDNPQLNVREWIGKNPTRIVIDKSLRINPSFNIFDNSIKTIIFNEKVNKIIENTEYVKINFAKEIINEILQILHQKDIQSIIVEGGAILLNTFISQNLWDEAYLFVGQRFFNNGIAAPSIKQIPKEIEFPGKVGLFYYRNQ